MHETIEALSAYVDGEVTAAERARIEAHLRACQDCASRRALLERSSRSVASLPPVVPTTDEARRIRQGVLDKAPRRRLLPGWVLRPAWAGAGALALVVAGVFGAGVLLRGPDRDEGGHTTAERASSPAAQPAFESPQEIRAFVSNDRQVSTALRALGESAADAGAVRIPAPAAPKSLQDDPGLSAPLPGNTAGGSAETTAQAAGEQTGEECLHERGRDQASGTVPLDVRPATLDGVPVWLLVYAGPPTGPDGHRGLIVYVVSRTDCGTLNYQLIANP